MEEWIIFALCCRTSKTLEIPLDAKLDGEQLCYHVPTPDPEGNDVKMAFIKWDFIYLYLYIKIESPKNIITYIDD
jgi:hypothetical protein